MLLTLAACGFCGPAHLGFLGSLFTPCSAASATTSTVTCAEAERRSGAEVRVLEMVRPSRTRKLLAPEEEEEEAAEESLERVLDTSALSRARFVARRAAGATDATPPLSPPPSPSLSGSLVSTSAAWAAWAAWWADEAEKPSSSLSLSSSLSSIFGAERAAAGVAMEEESPALELAAAAATLAGASTSRSCVSSSTCTPLGAAAAGTGAGAGAAGASLRAAKLAAGARNSLRFAAPFFLNSATGAGSEDDEDVEAARSLEEVVESLMTESSVSVE